MVKQAVILVAGVGSRLHSVTGDVIPKGGLEIDGKGLVERSLFHLKNVGVERVILVVGHLREYYDSLAERVSCDSFIVETEENSRYAETGSMASLAKARERLDEEDFLMLEGDLIYDPFALQVLQNGVEKRSTLLLCEHKHFGDDYFFEIVGQKVSRLSTSERDFNAYGELTGISRFTYSDFLVLCDGAKRESDSIHYEAMIAKCAEQRDFYFSLVNGLLWSEIDDGEHLERVQKELLPKLRAKGVL